MRYYILCGEASGDLHGANLMKAIKVLDPSSEFRYWGGDLMEAEGGNNVVHIKERAFMGFVEVLLNIFKIRKFLALAKNDIKRYRPDRLVFIDYPGFNLRIAAWAHKNGIKTHYYISPKVWAWNTKRAIKIKQIVDFLYVIFPFEVRFYEQFDYKVHYVGNPLVDAIENFKIDPDFKIKNKFDESPILAILPGSRKQEIDAILPLVLEVAQNYVKDYSIALAVAPNFARSFYQKFKGIENVKLIEGNTYNLLAVSEAAMVTSGTATLETALFNVPQVVCYKTSKLNYVIARLLVKVKFISLVNLIMGREIIVELIQNHLTNARLKAELDKIITDPGRARVLSDYKTLKLEVGDSGASARVAEFIVKG